MILEGFEQGGVGMRILKLIFSGLMLFPGAKLLRPPGAISSSQGSQEQNDVSSILTDTQEGKRKQSFDDGEHKGLKRLKTGQYFQFFIVMA